MKLVFYLISSTCHFHSAHMRPLFPFQYFTFSDSSLFCLPFFSLACLFLRCNAAAAAAKCIHWLFWLSSVRSNALHTIIPFLFTRFGCFSFSKAFFFHSLSAFAATASKAASPFDQRASCLPSCLGYSPPYTRECLFNQSEVKESVIREPMISACYWSVYGLFCSNSQAQLHGLSL